MDLLGNDITIYTSKVEHQVLRFVIDKPLEDLRLVFWIRPRLVRRASRKRRKYNKEIKENTGKRLIIDSECIWLSV